MVYRTTTTTTKESMTTDPWYEPKWRITTTVINVIISCMILFYFFFFCQLNMVFRTTTTMMKESTTRDTWYEPKRRTTKTVIRAQMTTRYDFTQPPPLTHCWQPRRPPVSTHRSCSAFSLKALLPLTPSLRQKVTFRRQSPLLGHFQVGPFLITKRWASSTGPPSSMLLAASTMKTTTVMATVTIFGPRWWQGPETRHVSSPGTFFLMIFTTYHTYYIIIKMYLYYSFNFSKQIAL